MKAQTDHRRALGTSPPRLPPLAHCGGSSTPRGTTARCPAWTTAARGGRDTGAPPPLAPSPPLPSAPPTDATADTSTWCRDSLSPPGVTPPSSAPLPQGRQQAGRPPHSCGCSFSLPRPRPPADAPRRKQQPRPWPSARPRPAARSDKPSAPAASTHTHPAVHNPRWHSRWATRWRGPPKPASRRATCGRRCAERRLSRARRPHERRRSPTRVQADGSVPLPAAATDPHLYRTLRTRPLPLPRSRPLTGRPEGRRPRTAAAVILRTLRVAVSPPVDPILPPPPPSPHPLTRARVPPLRPSPARVHTSGLSSCAHRRRRRRRRRRRGV